MVEQPQPTVTAAVQEDVTLASGDVTNAQPTEESTIATEQSEQTKPTEQSKQGVVPEKYDIKAPEGFEIDQAMLDSFTPLFKELGITQQAAQKLADAYAPIIRSKVEESKTQALNEFKKIVDGWKKESLTELGTESKQSLALVAKGRSKFGDEAFVTMLNETGIGNHPAMIRFLMNVGKSVAEDKFPDSKNIGGKDHLKSLYPTMK